MVTTFAVFCLRAVEQARLSLAYARRNAKIVASHPGLDVGPDGGSAQALEDIAAFRAIPGMTVISPADPIEMAQATRAILEFDGPVYMRTGRSPAKRLFDESHKFEIGKGEIIRNGKDVTLVACGVEVGRALEAAELLGEEKISARVVNMATIKPIDAKLLARCARETGAIVTAEDHNIHGGLGGAVAEALAGTNPCPIEFVGMKDEFGASGEPDELAEHFGIACQRHRRSRDVAPSPAKAKANEPLLARGQDGLRHRRQPRHRPRHCHRPGRGRRRCGPHLSQRAGDAETLCPRDREAWPPRHRRADGRDGSRQRRSRRQRRARLRTRLDPRQQCRHQQADRFRSGHRRGLGSILDTNLKGPFICAQVFLPLLKEAGGGSIVHIGSVSGQYGGPRTAHYAASKAGLISLAQVIARFGAPHNIRSNTVAAGLIASEMAAAGMAAASVQKAAEAIVLKRMGTQREVADAVVFLASDASSYITAQTLNVNGGLYF